MTYINAIIVDDEASAAHTLRGMLEEFCPTVTILHTANSVEQGVFAANQYSPDLVFLDIEIAPSGTGFDFLRQTNHLSFGVVFTTAHAHYAVKAINIAQPWAYLIKPYKAMDLMQAVQTALAKAQAQSSASPSKPLPRGIILPDFRKGSIVVHFTDLICCLSDTSCTVFHFFSEDKVEQLHVYKTLREVEAELPAHIFCRVHHGAIVNMAYVRRFERVGRSGKVHLSAGLATDVSAQKMEYFSRTFDLFLRGTEPK